MYDNDRLEFDAQLTELFRGFPKRMITPESKNAYWRGLSKMQLSTFVRCVDYALQNVEITDVPSVSKLWEISRIAARSRFAPHSAAPIEQKPTVEISRCQRHANRCLMAYLGKRPEKTSPEELKLFLASKHRIASSYDFLDEHGELVPEDGKTIMDALFKAWDSDIQKLKPEKKEELAA